MSGRTSRIQRRSRRRSASSQREAERLAAPLVAEWHDNIEKARASNARETVFILGPLRVKRSANSFDLETQDGTPISKHSLRAGLYREVAKDWLEQHWRAHFDAAAKSEVQTYAMHELGGLHSDFAKNTNALLRLLKELGLERAQRDVTPPAPTDRKSVV